MRAQSRGRGGVIVGSRPVVPAAVVPEELVSQAQMVLQGKSRAVIIRELQRTVSLFIFVSVIVIVVIYLSLTTSPVATRQ